MFGRTTGPLVAASASTIATAPDVNGVWRCSSCGEMASPAIPAFRWAGDCWQHSHPEAQTSFECRYFGPHPEPQYKPITFEETAGVMPPDWPANVARPLMPLKKENASGFRGRPVVPPPPVHGWERVCEITREGAAPLGRHIALSRDFDLAVHNILDYAETRLLEGEDVQLDRVAELITAKVRENLQLVYRPAPQGR